MLQFQVLQFALESLVLASLTGVVLLLQYTLSTGNARREVAAAFFAVNVTSRGKRKKSTIQ